MNLGGIIQLITVAMQLIGLKMVVLFGDQIRPVGIAVNKGSALRELLFY